MTLSYFPVRKKSFIEHINNPSGLFVLLSFFVLCLFIRFPFFFRDFIDHDESTFIIMGQSMADGHLPYTQLWDLKPPFVFFYFAAIIQLFGKSFIAIRLSGVVVITLTAWFVSFIGKDIKSARFGFYTGLGYIVLSSLFGTMQGLMSEHLAMFFCVGGTCLFLKKRDHLWGLFLSAVLLGTACLFRSNMVYSIPFLLGTYLFTSKLGVLKFVTNGFFLFLGMIVAPIISFLVYWFNDISIVWWNSVVKAALAYAGSSSGNFIGVAQSLSVCIILIGISFLYKKKIGFFRDNDPNVRFLRMFTVGLMFMLIKGGRLNGHYLVQLFPFMLFFAFEVFSLIQFSRLKKVGFLLWILLLIPAESYLEYWKLGKRLSEGKSMYNGPAFDAVDYIKDNQQQEKSVLFMSYHIGYWLLDMKPPSKIGTHPSNIMRSYFYEHVYGSEVTPMDELRKLFDQKPEFVVNKCERLYFAPKQSEANHYYQEQIQQHYLLVKEYGRAKIYKRSSNL